MSFGLLTEEQGKTLRDRYSGLEKVIWPSAGDAGVIKCLHDQCPLCSGTGVRKDGLGLCFHGIACPCPKCNFSC